MRSIKKIICLIPLLCLLFLYQACKKPEGPGGKALVKGKVFASDFDNTQQYLVSKGYSPGENVYICYGNTDVVGNNVKTGIDGSYEFRYLTKGHYKVFANSLDTSIKVKGNKTEKPVIIEFDITDTKQTKTLDDIFINK